MQGLFDKIKDKISLGQNAEALALIEEELPVHDADKRARLLYLRGSLYMKMGDWQQAMSSFIQSESLDRNGPGAEARKMLKDILDFYNKDLYNP